MRLLIPLDCARHRELFAKWWQLDCKYLACVCVLEGGDSLFLGAPKAGEKKTAVLPAAAAPGLKEGEKSHHWTAFSAEMRASPARSEVLDLDLDRGSRTAGDQGLQVAVM
ncbi:uncharacterized protein [Taeniopygia guttata]|uniref:uncharacterized protein isoform X2 n=1 Tax=Taeniopygia guttata TaxID=59729 RepID=UPI003BB92297